MGIPQARIRLQLLLVIAACSITRSAAFVPRQFGQKAYSSRLLSSTSTDPATVVSFPDFNGVPVAKEGGMGAVTASQQALARGLSLGAPPVRPKGGHHLTKGGVQVTANVDRLVFSSDLNSDARTSARAIEELVDQLDHQKGVLLTSSYEFPGRYARWSLGFVDPPLEISGRGSECTITALNSRGKVLMPAIQVMIEQLKKDGILQSFDIYTDDGSKGTGDGLDSVATRIEAKVCPPAEVGSFSEEDRSRQASLFSVIRALVDLFGYQGGDRQLGLYGAFGYDLTFQFEPIDLKLDRNPEQRDLLLYLPDKILVVDQDKRDAWTVSYEFCVNQRSTQGLDRLGASDAFQAFDEKVTPNFKARDTPKNEFASSVEKAKREFAVGNLFEAVLSQTFREKLSKETPPSVLFRRLRARNPAPYGFVINLGEQEYLVGASPEMFVRCEATDENDYRPGAIRVETCPISGTVARGADALEDAQRVKSLMMNAKEESELTMCTDVDRNDKSRICEPGSVQVIGRRQIEMYSRLIHTVDHVEGYLRPEFDALDAFLCHTWAVTVTGAPKTWAIQFVEDTERSQRCWYGGAVGMVGFDGSLNTGLTLRTVRVKNGVAEVRAGATLLYDSSPPAEELETELKASAMIDAIVQSGLGDNAVETAVLLKKKLVKVGDGKSVILIDHEDSFVHTLGNYLRQTGASVRTLRSGPSALATIESLVNKGEKPDLVILSPGPGNPSDFGLSTSIEFLTQHRIPAFGVCLGLQGMVEHFGGSLGVLGYPMHGKPSQVTLSPAGKTESSIFAGLPDAFEVARYHSLYGIKERLPSCLEVTATSEDGIIMGIQHKTLPFAAVQFHPESILTSPAHGMAILQNVLSFLRYDQDESQTIAGINTMSGAELVGKLEELSVSELKIRLAEAGLSSTGSKSELIVKLALWTHKSNEAKAGRLALDSLTVPELRELKHGLGLKGTTPTRTELLAVLETCLHQK
jgi:anthranilate synthase